MLASAKQAATHVIGVRGKKALKYWKLRAEMALGKEPFTALNGLDRKLLEWLPRDRPGFFIEAGANDGVDQSNTFYLEQRLGWRGLLIEPSAEHARLAARFRSAKVIHSALGTPDDAGGVLTLPFLDLVSGSSRNRQPVKWAGLLGPNPTTIQAPIRTLSEVLDSEGSPEVDLFSLDVEGAELAVLAGLDLARHRPALILVETSQEGAVSAMLGAHYTMVGKLSFHDYLYKRR